MSRHWQSTDFVVTAETPAYDGSPAVNQFGYCRICKADMQRFGTDGQHSPLKHYASHQAAKRLGVWGKVKY